jgi:hypothetical protein
VSAHVPLSSLLGSVTAISVEFDVSASSGAGISHSYKSITNNITVNHVKAWGVHTRTFVTSHHTYKVSMIYIQLRKYRLRRDETGHISKSFTVL